MGAGHNSPSILGGPWHAGDEITMSILLRNEGDIAGNAEFEVEIDGTIQTSIPISLDSSKAGELSHTFTFSSSGDHLLSWSVKSPDGIVNSNLSGSVTIPVLKSQTLTLKLLNNNDRIRFYCILVRRIIRVRRGRSCLILEPLLIASKVILLSKKSFTARYNLWINEYRFSGWSIRIC